MKRYYDLNEDGTNNGSYARFQPNIEGLVLLEEPDDPTKTVWTGTEWEINLNKYKKATWRYLFAYLQENLFDIIVSRRDSGTPDFNSDDIAVKAKNFRDNLAGLATKEEVDAAKQSALDWAGIEE